MNIKTIRKRGLHQSIEFNSVDVWTGNQYEILAHCEDGPATIYWYDEHVMFEIWMLNDVKHRLDGPAERDQWSLYGYTLNTGEFDDYSNCNISLHVW